MHGEGTLVSQTAAAEISASRNTNCGQTNVVCMCGACVRLTHALSMFVCVCVFLVFHQDSVCAWAMYMHEEVILLSHVLCVFLVVYWEPVYSWSFTENACACLCVSGLCVCA